MKDHPTRYSKRDDFFQNIQDSNQARKCKIPIEEMKKKMVPTQNDENPYQDKEYNSDDETSDFENAEYVEAYDDYD
jgi:hypothetical protein